MCVISRYAIGDPILFNLETSMLRPSMFYSISFFSRWNFNSYEKKIIDYMLEMRVPQTLYPAAICALCVVKVLWNSRSQQMLIPQLLSPHIIHEP